MPTEEKRDGFLSRWSQRKLASEEVAPEGEVAESPLEVQEPEAERELTDEEILEKLELPDPDTLKQGDDFSVFMNGAVPDRLRNRALRKLWLSNSALANLDELVDYGEDFTDAATVIENLKTVYEVGKGAAGRVLKELEEKAKAEALAAAEAAETAPEEPAAALDSDEAEPEQLPEPDPAPSHIVDKTCDESARPRVRAMAFSFENES